MPSLLPLLLLLAGPPPMPVPLGVTDLFELPQCTVGYQRFDEPPVSLGYL